MSADEPGPRPVPPHEAAPPPADDAIAAALRGFGPLGLAAVVAILFGNGLFVPLSALLVLAWAWRSRTPWSALGLGRPAHWTRTLLFGAAWGALFKLLMKSVVMPLLEAPAINPAYHHLAGDTAALPGMLWAVIAGAGFGEELVFRGWMFERAGALLGRSAPARLVTVLVTTAWFAAGHYANQGLPGVEQAAFTGLVFGTVYALTGRLWMVIAAHAAFDVVAVGIIYGGLEARVAHWFIR